MNNKQWKVRIWKKAIMPNSWVVFQYLSEGTYEHHEQTQGG